MPTARDYRRISYDPSVTVDRLSESGQKGLTPVNGTLARRLSSPGLYELYFHANSKLTALDNSRDVSRDYKVLRLRRQWEGQLTGRGLSPIATNYELIRKRGGPRSFERDYGAKSWVDCPGDRLTGRTSRSYRALQEFVTAIGDRLEDRRPVPEFGGLYYLVAIDITPERYKVWISLEKRLTPDQMLGAMGVFGKSFPADLISPGREPDFAAWRYVSSDWQDYTKWTV
jgi:hypothetical protein